MKVIYMGTPDFAVGPLEKIWQAGHQISAVVTQPDKQKGRGREVQYPPVKEWAVAHGIPVLQPVKIKAAEAVAELKKYPADIFVVAAFGQILSEEILRLPPLGCICIHASLLPKYRGAAPIQRAIIDGETESGITIMQMDKGIDTGDILLTGRIPITSQETGASLHDKLSAVGADLVVEALSRMEAGGITPVKQKDADSSYAPMLTKEEGCIHWEKPAEQLERLIRGLNSWPSAYTFYQGKTLKIWRAETANPNADNQMPERTDMKPGLNDTKAEATNVKLGMTDGKPGTITGITKDSILVATGGGNLRIKELQLEGKKRMPVKEFLLGCKMTVGEGLG